MRLPNFTDESISFEAHGVDGTMTAKVDLEHDATEYSITEELELRQQFGLKYIEFMHSFGGLATEINMYFSENQPFHAKYNLAEGVYKATITDTNSNEGTTLVDVSAYTNPIYIIRPKGLFSQQDM